MAVRMYHSQLKITLSTKVYFEADHVSVEAQELFSHTSCEINCKNGTVRHETSSRICGCHINV